MKAHFTRSINQIVAFRASLPQIWTKRERGTQLQNIAMTLCTFSIILLQNGGYWSCSGRAIIPFQRRVFVLANLVCTSGRSDQPPHKPPLHPTHPTFTCNSSNNPAKRSRAAIYYDNMLKLPTGSQYLLELYS